MNIGQRLRVLREMKKLTLEDLGNMVGVNKATIARYETGIIDIKRTTAIKLSEIFEVSPAFIMGWEEESSNETKSSKSDCVNLTSDEKNLLDNYSRLNNDGKDKAQEYVSDLTTMDKYTQANLKSKLNA